MINKIFPTVEAALADVADGATVMVGGFGTAGLPNELTDALLAQGARDLTLVNNNAGNGDTGLAALLAAGRVKKIICSFPRQADSHHFDRLYRAGKIDAIPAVGGAMDLAIGAKKTLVMMEHCTKAGESKLVPRCTYPLTGLGCVSRVYTDLAVIDLGPQGATVVEMCEGLDLAQLQALTAVPLVAD